MLEDAPSFRSHVGHHLFHFGKFLVVSRCRSCNSHGHSKNLSEGVPESQSVFLRYSLRSRLEIESETVRLSDLYEVVGKGRLVIIDSRLPIVAELFDDPAVFRDDVFAGYEFDPIVREPVVAICCDLSQFYERVSPVVGIQAIFHKLFEPRCIEAIRCLFILLSFFVDQLEGAREYESLSLLYTSG